MGVVHTYAHGRLRHVSASWLYYIWDSLSQKKSILRNSIALVWKCRTLEMAVFIIHIALDMCVPQHTCRGSESVLSETELRSWGLVVRAYSLSHLKALFLFYVLLVYLRQGLKLVLDFQCCWNELLILLPPLPDSGITGVYYVCAFYFLSLKQGFELWYIWPP